LQPSPKQHIYRSANLNWSAQNFRTRSIFHIRSFMHANNVAGVQRQFPYWGPYDLLGFFLSLVWTAPSSATKRNFFLPWTAIYGRWCSKLGNAIDHGFQHPTVYQCTWYIDSSGQKTFFLGASAAGYKAFPRREFGTWRETVRRARFNLIWNECRELRDDTDENGRHWSFDNSPSIQVARGTRFGNCAETYPFLNQFLLVSNSSPFIFHFLWP